MTITTPFAPTVLSALRVAPQQGRAAATLTTILDAAEQCITTIGIERFTTADVARTADVPIGTVYRYFADRVAILDALRPGRHTALNEANQAIKETAGYLEQTQANVITGVYLRPWSQSDLLEFIDGALTLLKGGE